MARPEIPEINLLRYIDANGELDLSRIPDSVAGEIEKIDLARNLLLKTIKGDFERFSNVKRIDLSYCLSLTTLPATLPARLTKLDLLRCESLTAIPATLPAELTNLVLLRCESLTAIPETLPAGLRYLYLSGCRSLTAIPETLPDGITKLELLFCTSLTTLPATLPAGLTSLNLSGCTSLTTLPATLPAGIIDLRLSRCTSLETLPETLPAGLIYLDLFGCTSLTAIPENLPAGIIDLRLSGCTSLTTLPATIPAEIGRVDLSGCASLETLPETLPAGLRYLDLSGCINLPNTPALIAQLISLEEANAYNPNSRLIWPEHLDRNLGVRTIQSDVATAYKEYWRQNNDRFPGFESREPSASDIANCPTLALIHRFMSESVSSRGGMSELIASMRTVVDAIKENPNLLEFIDEVSKHSLQACVNQPVQGFIEISFLAAISQKTNIPEKIDAARGLLVLDTINKFVPTLCNSGGKRVQQGAQVALANLMFGKLFELGLVPQEWSGIPKGIAYAGAVASFLTEENVAKVMAAVDKVLKASPEQVAEMVCESRHQDSFANLVLSKEEIGGFESYKALQVSKAAFSENEDESKFVDLVESIKKSEADLRKEKLTTSKAKTLTALGVSGERPSTALAAAGAAAVADQDRDNVHGPKAY